MRRACPRRRAGISHDHRHLAHPGALDAGTALGEPAVQDPDEAIEGGMGCRESRLVGEGARFMERIRIDLGAPHDMPNLLEALRGEKDRARAMLALVDAGTRRSKQRDHGDETDGEQGQCGEHFRERQTSLLRWERMHVYGPIETRPDAATATVRVRPLTASVTV